MNRERLSTGLALVALAAAVAGCGGGSSANTGSTDTAKSASSTTKGSSEGSEQSSPLSKQAFIKKADAICAQTQKSIETEYLAFLKKKKIKEIGEKGESPKEAEAHATEAIETVGIPQLSKQAEELRELEAPAEVEAKFNAYLAAIEKEIEGGEKDPTTLAGSAKEVFAESDAAAQGIGFKVCAVHN